MEPDKTAELVASSDELGDLARKPSLEKVQAFENALRSLDQLELETDHHFAEGIYARELRIPAGVILTGRMHKRGQMNVLAKGEITVWTEGGMRRIKAPAVIPSKAGAKRVGYAHTDTVWITIHATDETDVDKIEDELIVPEDPELEKLEVAKWLGQQ
jgi:hypothetical protein